MDELRIETGEKHLVVNGDPARVIVFNPEDVMFAERFYQVVGEFDRKQYEYELRFKEIEADDTKDANGLPGNTTKKLELVRETCVYFREKIDQIFGAGTSQTAFGDAMTLNMFEQFFKGISPYIQGPRAGKVAKYVNTAVKPKRPRHK